MKFSLVIPCYNEASNIPLLLDRCQELVRRRDIEVILVDNGSTDDTRKILECLLPSYPGCCSVRVEVNRGYGYGILAGLRAAKGDVVGWSHADLQTDPQDFLHGVRLFEEHGPHLFVKGRRFGRRWGDTIFTIGMSVFETMLLRKAMWDINAQPTMFTRKFFEAWTDPPEDFSLDLYAYYRARCQNIMVCRFPVRFGERAHGVSHWNVNWAAKWKFIRRTLQFSFELRQRLKS